MAKRWPRQVDTGIVGRPDGQEQRLGIQLYDWATGKKIRQLAGTQERSSTRWRFRRTARRWPPRRGTERFGSGTRPRARKSTGARRESNLGSSRGVFARMARRSPRQVRITRLLCGRRPRASSSAGLQGRHRSRRSPAPCTTKRSGRWRFRPMARRWPRGAGTRPSICGTRPRASKSADSTATSTG